MPELDFLIRGGQIIDGTGAARRSADIGIHDDRIIAVGNLDNTHSRRIIDATNLVVSPGFIDVHNHSDAWLLREANFAPKTRQGFTTEILMADGISYAPVNPDTAYDWIFYLRALNGLRVDQYESWNRLIDYAELLDCRTAQNFLFHIPYANVRTMHCGFGRAAVDDFQMRGIQADIARGMEQGAVGLSTGLDYIGQCFATTDELATVCEAMRPHGGVYVTHVRYKSGLMKAVREAVEIGRRAGVPVHISHLKAATSEAVDEMLEYIDESARHEVDFSFDVYPYQPGSTMLSYLLPYDFWVDGPLAAMGKLADPKLRRRFRDGLRAYRLHLDRITIAWLPGEENRRHLGSTLADYVAQSGQQEEDALCNLLIEERLAVLCVMNEGDDELVRPFLQHDLFMMGSDGIYHPESKVHPRVCGSAPRLLGPCVRDWRLFSLEEAVAKMTSKPARRFGIRERGELREGYFADLAIFDPDTVADQATYESPLLPPVGIHHVFVNGQPIVEAGEPIHTSGSHHPGRYLRFQDGKFS